MTIYKHELKQGKLSLLVWTACIATMLALCVLIYPSMGNEIKTISKLFSNMGAFSAAFGMDKLNFGEFIGFFCVECGNVVGLGGSFFAGLIGISALAKEEREHTAEFLFTHPLSRTQIITEKLLAIFTQLLVLNVICIAATFLCMAVIKESAPMKPMFLLFLAYFLMQLEIAGITFGISAFIRHGELGIGLGFAAISYFLNICANLSPKAKALKYFTPFGYTDGADIVADHALPMNYLIVGMIFMIVGIAAAYIQYRKKDLS